MGLDVKVIVEPDGYQGGPHETNFMLTITCLPCRRAKPRLNPSRLASSETITLTEESLAGTSYDATDLTRKIFEIVDDDIPC